MHFNVLNIRSHKREECIYIFVYIYICLRLMYVHSYVRVFLGHTQPCAWHLQYRHRPVVLLMGGLGSTEEFVKVF